MDSPIRPLSHYCNEPSPGAGNISPLYIDFEEVDESFKPKFRDLYEISSDRLQAWVDKAGIKSSDKLAVRIIEEVKKLFSRVGGLKRLELESGDFFDSDSDYKCCAPPVLFSKYSKGGKTLKMGINAGFVVGKGTRMKVMAIPVVRITGDEIDIKPKALIVSRKVWNEDLFKHLENGVQVQKEARKNFDQREWDEPSIAPLPRSISKEPGIFVQRLLGRNLQKFCDLEWERKVSILTLQDKLRILLDVAYAVAAVDKTRNGHFDVRPANIIVTPQRRGCLIDFDNVRKYEDDEDVYDEDRLFPYRGSLWMNAKDRG